MNIKCMGEGNRKCESKRQEMGMQKNRRAESPSYTFMDWAFSPLIY
jgi:hypothetical protein